MEHLEEIAERIRNTFDTITIARDRALTQTRALTRYSAQAIRHVHRDERAEAKEALLKAKGIVDQLRTELSDFPELFYAGYTQDALKEYAEAEIVSALIKNSHLPKPDDIQLEGQIYLKGLAEAVGELRRRILDILIKGHSKEADRLLEHMDDIYAILVTMDYPDAVTGGLRRLTDIVRSINERTRSDVLISKRYQELEKSLEDVEAKLNKIND